MNKMRIIALGCFTTMFSCDRPTSAADNSDPIVPAGSQVIRSVDSQEAKVLLQEEKDLMLLDVRTPEEFAEGHLAGAKNMDYNNPNFNEQIQQTGNLAEKSSILISNV